MAYFQQQPLVDEVMMEFPLMNPNSIDHRNPRKKIRISNKKHFLVLGQSFNNKNATPFQQIQIYENKT